MKTTLLPNSVRSLCWSFARGICQASTLEKKAKLARVARMFDKQTQALITLHVIAIASAQAFASKWHN